LLGSEDHFSPQLLPLNLVKGIALRGQSVVAELDRARHVSSYRLLVVQMHSRIELLILHLLVRHKVVGREVCGLLKSIGAIRLGVG